jgi:hypothetical protein
MNKGEIKVRAVCHDCGVPEGDIHQQGRDMESCPTCGGQLISCDCPDPDHRIPFILYPNMCCKCGALWPEMFSVPDEKWEYYVEPSMRRKMLCEGCYNQIKEWINVGSLVD